MAYAGALITRSYDSLLVKISAWASEFDQTCNRADRALVTRARALKQCLAAHRSHPRKCKADQTALQHTGAQLAAARRGHELCRDSLRRQQILVVV